MKKRQCWRYTCDFCKKSNCSASSIAKHERHCTKNPNRVCRMCIRVGDVQATMTDLIASIRYVDEPLFGDRVASSRKLGELRNLSHNCPACILSALRQVPEDREDPILEGDPFSWRDESKAWIEDYRNSCEGDSSSDMVFVRENWEEYRAKRFPSPATQPA